MELSQLSRDELLALAEAYARHCLSIDGYWFMAVEDKFGHQAAFELDDRVWARLAAVEANRMARALKIQGRDIPAILRTLMFSPIFLSLGPQVTQADVHTGLFTITDCRVQKNRAQEGRPEFECKPVGLTYVSRFVQALNPAVKVSCVVCPPDPHPPNVWCQWQLQFPGKPLGDVGESEYNRG